LGDCRRKDLNRLVFSSFYGWEKDFSSFFSFCVLTRVVTRQFQWGPTWWWVDDAHINNTQHQQQPRWLVIFPRLQIGTIFFFFSGGFWNVRLCVCDTCPPPQLIGDDDDDEW
jgi:hypothetical protein